MSTLSPTAQFQNWNASLDGLIAFDPSERKSKALKIYNAMYHAFENASENTLSKNEIETLEALVGKVLTYSDANRPELLIYQIKTVAHVHFAKLDKEYPQHVYASGINDVVFNRRVPLLEESSKKIENKKAKQFLATYVTGAFEKNRKLKGDALNCLDFESFKELLPFLLDEVRAGRFHGLHPFAGWLKKEKLSEEQFLEIAKICYAKDSFTPFKNLIEGTPLTFDLASKLVLAIKWKDKSARGNCLLDIQKWTQDPGNQEKIGQAVMETLLKGKDTDIKRLDFSKFVLKCVGGFYEAHAFLEPVYERHLFFNFDNPEKEEELRNYLTSSTGLKSPRLAKAYADYLLRNQPKVLKKWVHSIELPFQAGFCPYSSAQIKTLSNYSFIICTNIFGSCFIDDFLTAQDEIGGMTCQIL